MSGLQPVSRPPDRQQVLGIRRVGLRLPSKLSDMKVHGPGHDIGVGIFPDLLQEFGSRGYRSVCERAEVTDEAEEESERRIHKSLYALADDSTLVEVR